MTVEKVNNNVTKYLLRKAERDCPGACNKPAEIRIPCPNSHWLKDEIYDWAVQLISISETDYIMDKRFIDKLLDDHRLNKKDNSRKLWTILMFMLWHQVFVEGMYDTFFEE